MPYGTFSGLWSGQESGHSKKCRDSRPVELVNNEAYGDEGVRTPDLVVANHALSQLSYIPLSRSKWAYLDSNQGPQLYQSCALAN